MSIPVAKKKPRCQYAESSPDQPQCRKTSTCKWGQYWFCDEHGSGRGKGKRRIKMSAMVNAVHHVTSLGDNELRHTIASLLRKLHTKKGRAELLWMVARIDGWRLDLKVQNDHKFWHWNRKGNVKVYAAEHPNYLEDRNAVARMEDKLSDEQAIKYSELMWTILRFHHERTPGDPDMLRANAAYRCVGLLARYINEFNQAAALP